MNSNQGGVSKQSLLKDGKKVRIKSLVVIAKLSDGTYRQILTTKKENDFIQGLILQLHGDAIKVLENKLEGIEF